MKRLLIPASFVLLTLAVSACASGPPPIELTVEMTEFAFTPDSFEVQVGQEVTFHLINEGALEHEFMIGRTVRMVDGLPSGYEENLFEEGEPQVTGGSHEHSDGTGSADHGFMVVVPMNGAEATVTFTVTPDMVGEWEIGCFTGSGTHYNQGMVGTLTVVP